MNIRFESRWLDSLIYKMVLKNLNPERQSQVNHILEKVFSNIDLTDDHLFPLNVKLSIISQLYLGISTYQKNKEYLTESEMLELLLASITVAMKEEYDECGVGNKYLRDAFWWNVEIIKGELKVRLDYAELNRIEREYLIRINYSSRLSVDKLIPVLNGYAGAENLFFIRRALQDSNYSFFHAVENKVEAIIGDMLQNKINEEEQELPEDEMVIPSYFNKEEEEFSPLVLEEVEVLTTSAFNQSENSECQKIPENELIYKANKIKENLNNIHDYLNKRNAETKNRCFGYLNRDYQEKFKTWQGILIRMKLIFDDNNDDRFVKNLLEFIDNEAKKYKSSSFTKLFYTPREYYFTLLNNLLSVLSALNSDELKDICTNKLSRDYLRELRSIRMDNSLQSEPINAPISTFK